MRLSKEKRQKIQEQIVSYLLHIYPKSNFTAEIAREIVRDEEFCLGLLRDLENKKIISRILKNSKGEPYSRRIRWRLSTPAYSSYKTQ
jgi:predicted transcriptional regulator with HTH domain